MGTLLVGKIKVNVKQLKTWLKYISLRLTVMFFYFPHQIFFPHPITRKIYSILSSLLFLEFSPLLPQFPPLVLTISHKSDTLSIH